MLSSLFRSSHASKRSSKSYARDSDHSPHSRSFDRCSPPFQQSFSPHDRRQQEVTRRSESRHRDQQRSHRSHRDTNQGSQSKTYGTYIFPLKTRGSYKNMDPTVCRCNCCPHPGRVLGGSNVHQHDPDAHRRHDVGGSSQRSRECDSSRQPESSRHSSHHQSRGRLVSSGQRLIDVVDESSGLIHLQHGRNRSIAVSATTSVDSILARLAPDGSHAKVVIRWRDGRRETLSNKVSMDKLRLDAKWLEVQDKKRVHWKPRTRSR